MAPERTNGILRREDPGVFLVRKNTSLDRMVLSVRIPDQEGAPQLQDLLIQEEKSFLYLEGSVLVFDDIFKLIAFYCISRDILPFPLRLPHAVAQADKYEDMEVISNLGSDFWTSSFNCSDKGQGCVKEADLPSLKSLGEDALNNRSCEIKLSAGNNRLWYINPIFVENCSNGSGDLPQDKPIITSQKPATSRQPLPRYKRPPPLPPPPKPPSAELTPAVKLARNCIGESSPPITSCPLSLLNMDRSKQEVEVNTDSAVSAPEQPQQTQPSSTCEADPSAPSPICGSEKAHPAAESLPGSSGSVPLSDELLVLTSEEKDSAVLKPLQVTSDKVCPSGLSPQTPSLCGPKPRIFPKRQIPPVPPRGKPSKKHPEDSTVDEEIEVPKEDKVEGEVAVATLVCVDDATVESPPTGQEGPLQERRASHNVPPASLTVGRASRKKPPPVPPPRKKRSSQDPMPDPSSQSLNEQKEDQVSGLPQASSTSTPTHRKAFAASSSKGADISLYSPEGQAALVDVDSCSTSSAEEESETPTLNSCSSAITTPASKPPNSNVILDKAKQKLSMVTLSNVLTGFMSPEKKLKKRVVELSRDGESYFGSLVRHYRAFTLETMRGHNSSTELLQEIRLMMNQHKSYLVQSVELKALVEPAVYTEEKLEGIIESALCKSVLKPIREAVYSGLRDIHARDGALQRLEENQQTVLGTTTTDLGITTSVPEAPIMEKIHQKLASLHREYSPEKKNALLLKTCKIIYESMSVGCPGKAHGADDFLPVLMYVVARSNIVALLLDVEYTMELMDPTMQLGEGSYYLTAIYGALEHIKNYNKMEAPGQLSLEIQDSINRWERRRTLNKANASRSCVQDFISVSFLEAGSNTKTLGAHPNTTAQDLCAQCAEKFEVLEQESYVLSVLVDGQYRPLAPSELPLSVKSDLHHSQPRKEYFFVYRPGSWSKEAKLPEPPPTPPLDSLI